MNYKQVEKMLYQYNYFKTKIKMNNIKIIELENEYKSNTIQAVDYSQIKVQNNSNNSLDSEVINKMNIEKKIKKLQNDNKRIDLQIDTIDTALSALTEYEYNIIELKYFENYSIDYIADTLYISRRSVFRQKNKAINKLVALL